MINAHSIAIRKVKKLLSDFNSHIAKTTKSLKPVVPLNKKYVKKNMQIIFQDPSNSLNERMSVEDIIAEGIKNFKGELGIKTKEEVYKIVYKAIGQMGLLEEYGSRYVHELSGGQKQRVSIARSIALTPSFIIADEPISSLDVSIRAQILNLLKALQKKMKLTYLFVAHDLSVVRFFCDRICVMYKGRIVEIAPTEDLFKKPLHRYTKVLLNSAPVGELDKAGYEKNIEKTYVDKSTPFNPCVLKEVAKGHFVLLPYKKED
jgi:oligopeptide transport system ATP-binding protein